MLKVGRKGKEITASLIMKLLKIGLAFPMYAQNESSWLSF